MSLMSRLALLAGLLVMPLGLVHGADSDRRDLLKQSKRIVFLGDSITFAGRYVACVDAWMESQRFDKKPLVIDAGLPSETVSGLSEDGHAGGKFPRPDLAERLDRVLATTKPDLVIACYGINCGIYLPFDAGRLEKYQQGITSLKTKVEKAGAKLILVTPPFYDDMKAPKSFPYNDVMDKYAEWLVSKRADGWQVIDGHTAMTNEVRKRRKTDPKFTLQPDGVHPNDEGHWCMAQQVIRWFGDEAAASAGTPQAMLALKQVPETAFPLINQRVAILRDAYVGAAGHKRPGIAAGLPLAEAEAKAKELSDKIDSLVRAK
jgi:lysophospholipase L1-like esterase